MCKRKILIIGEIFIDTHLDILDEGNPIVRLGGIFHSARAYSALNENYALAYYAPDYIEDDINYFSCLLKSQGCFKLGSIINAPNIMLVRESKETGDQGYVNILKDQAQYIDRISLLTVIEKVKPTDILIYPGRYDTNRIIDMLNNFYGKIHIDFHYDNDNILKAILRNIDTIILSTSSYIFKEVCNGTINGVIEYFKQYSISNILLKENRGGSCYFSCDNNDFFESPAYYVPTMHSVGVGDVFNSIFLSSFYDENLNKKIRFASLIASKYAETLKYDKFETNVQLLVKNAEELFELDGIRLPWEERKTIDIYIAAPDFPNINTTLLDKAVECLKYHNFNPRLPIRENGLVNETMDYHTEMSIYTKDIELIQRCDMLIAVLLFNDPGTLVELGIFKQTGKPTILYDPYNLCDNMFVKNTPDFFCTTIEGVIDSTFQCLRKR